MTYYYLYNKDQNCGYGLKDISAPGTLLQPQLTPFWAVLSKKQTCVCMKFLQHSLCPLSSGSLLLSRTLSFTFISVQSYFLRDASPVLTQPRWALLLHPPTEGECFSFAAFITVIIICAIWFVSILTKKPHEHRAVLPTESQQYLKHCVANSRCSINTFWKNEAMTG